MYDDVGCGSTAIFCRSNQFSEAAILLSCQQGEHFSPVINLDFPPCFIPEFKEKLKLYRKHETERNLLVGTRKARQDLVHQNQDAFASFRALDSRCQELLAELDPFRGWLKRRQALARPTSCITWKNVVFLFEPEPFDLVVPLSCYYNHQDEIVEEPSLLREDVPRVLFLPIEAPVSRAGDQFNLKTYRDLDELCSLSWQEFGPTGRPPEQWLESIAGEEGPILLHLYLAWQQGVPLRLHQRDPHEPVPSLEQVADQANEGIPSEEVVLVEEGVGMEGLLAVALCPPSSSQLSRLPQAGSHACQPDPAGVLGGATTRRYGVSQHSQAAGAWSEGFI